jgi:hypothetical protein
MLWRLHAGSNRRKQEERWRRNLRRRRRKERNSLQLWSSFQEEEKEEQDEQEEKEQRRPQSAVFWRGRSKAAGTVSSVKLSTLKSHGSPMNEVQCPQKKANGRTRPTFLRRSSVPLLSLVRSSCFLSILASLYLASFSAVSFASCCFAFFSSSKELQYSISRSSLATGGA